MKLTAEAQADRDAFVRDFDGGNCSCHLGGAPCGSCTHPGNPWNQEDESCWEPDWEEEAEALRRELDAMAIYRDQGWAQAEKLEAENERLRMQLVACSVVAMMNTVESAAKARDMHPDYMSASCKDVMRAVDSEIALRAEVERLRHQVEALQAAPDSWQSGYDKGRRDGDRFAREERDRLREEMGEQWKQLDKFRSQSHGIPALAEIERLRAEGEALRGLLKECAEYLDSNDLNSICAGSILHRKMIDAAKEAS